MGEKLGAGWRNGEKRKEGKKGRGSIIGRVLIRQRIEGFGPRVSRVKCLGSIGENIEERKFRLILSVQFLSGVPFNWPIFNERDWIIRLISVWLFIEWIMPLLNFDCDSHGVDARVTRALASGVRVPRLPVITSFVDELLIKNRHRHIPP